MSVAETADLWWKNAVVYCLDVQTFFDSDGDGIGDLAGLTGKVDYLAGLGVTCVWLMPIYPTADLDDGYDITDHYGIDPRLGSFGDFTEFVRTARDRGMRVIVDLVVNHTSDQHAWFQAARHNRESRFRDFYVWSDEIPADGPRGETFPGDQGGLWTWDPEAGQYYLHRFYRHQPDLNIASVEVRDEIRKLIGFWLAQNLSGFRVDAVPFLLELDGIGEAMELDPHEYLRDLRAFLNRRSGEAVLLGEVNLPPAEQRRYFGDEDGDELHLLFEALDHPLEDIGGCVHGRRRQLALQRCENVVEQPTKDRANRILCRWLAAGSDARGGHVRDGLAQEPAEVDRHLGEAAELLWQLSHAR